MLLLYTTTNNGGTAYIAGVKENVSRPQGGNVTTTNTLNHFLSPISFPLSKVKPSFKKKMHSHTSVLRIWISKAFLFRIII